MLGKEKCRILKQIRQRIADENDIPYVTRECTYQGDCLGTCPKCESELRYLEQELAKREARGKKIAVAALCALQLCPEAEKAMLASHVSAEKSGAEVLDSFGLSAPIRAGMRLGEGSGAVMLLPLLDMALALYRSGQSFERLGVEAYTPQN